MKPKLITLIFALLIGSIAHACFWDYDTIEMERQQFPSIIELLSGNFLQHSPEYYLWRIKDRESKLLEFPDSLGFMDDLAVSYAKTGNESKAIEIGLKQLMLRPNRYETLANLGTFHIHIGDMENGIKYIDQAIEINPAAHFGREIYQRHLAEYILSKMEYGKIPLPLSAEFSDYPDSPPEAYDLKNFYKFLIKKKKAQENLTNLVHLDESELEKAIAGITGMMKFGNANSPILSEALGDLLMNRGWYEGARQLAARAYLKASYNVDGANAKRIYLKKAAIALYHQYTKKNGFPIALDRMEKMFQEELAQGDKFYQNIQSDEIKWIDQDVNLDEAFNKKYYQEPQLGKRIQKGKRYAESRIKSLMDDSLIGQEVDYFQIQSTQDFLGSNKKDGIEKNESTEDNNENETNVGWVIIALTSVLLVVTIYYIQARRKSPD